MRLFRPCFPAGCLYPEAVFRIKTTGKQLCLTYDDGPDPASTPLLLDILRKSSVKAIFFCNGMKAEKYPGLVRMIREEGHVTGNHGYDHIDGWKTSLNDYIINARLAEKFTSDHLFRPPYGRITLKQYKHLKKRYRLFFWDLMPYDFDSEFGSRRSFGVLREKFRNGSVIVLHDSRESTVLEFIEEFITLAKDAGYEFVIPFS
jgi:peptidoglycan/xylan/chitin deacetylase (PgdA/CDA1 family)